MILELSIIYEEVIGVGPEEFFATLHEHQQLTFSEPVLSSKIHRRAVIGQLVVSDVDFSLSGIKSEEVDVPIEKVIAAKLNMDCSDGLGYHGSSDSVPELQRMKLP